MKESLVQYLRCPKCVILYTSRLTLTSFKTEQYATLEVMDGMLQCEKCSEIFPIISGIPRFVPNAVLLYPDFAAQYPQAITAKQMQQFKQVHGQTQERFSYEWMRYPGALPEDKPIFLNETQTQEGDWQGKLVLDAGCGMGRYSRVAHALGAQVIAMDIGTALIRLWDVAKSSERMHIVQGDLTLPPLAAECLDTVYSIGVIHHTPNAHHTFKQLVPLIKKGGTFTLWLYGAPGPWKNFKTNPLRQDRQHLEKIKFWVWLIVCIREGLSDFLRVFTVKMPHSLLYLICYPLAALGKIPLIKYLTFSVHSMWRVRLQENFDWLTPPYQSHHTKEELSGWFKESGFRVESILPHGFVPKPGVKGTKII